METKLIDGVELTLQETIERNIGLSKKVARRFMDSGKILGYDFEDLVNEGVFGLAKAYRDFDNSKGIKFSTFAYTKIFGEIQLRIRLSNQGAKFPVQIKDMANLIMRKELTSKNFEEVAEILRTSREKVVLAFEYIQRGRASSLDETLGDDSREDNTFYYLIGNTEDLSQIYVEEFLNKLTAKERLVAERTIEKYSRREIAKELGCTHQNVTTYLKKLKAKLYIHVNGVNRYGTPVA